MFSVYEDNIGEYLLIDETKNKMLWVGFNNGAVCTPTKDSQWGDPELSAYFKGAVKVFEGNETHCMNYVRTQLLLRS